MALEFRVEMELEMLVFVEIGKTGGPGEKTLGARMRRELTTNSTRVWESIPGQIGRR